MTTLLPTDEFDRDAVIQHLETQIAARSNETWTRFRTDYWTPFTDPKTGRKFKDHYKLRCIEIPRQDPRGAPPKFRSAKRWQMVVNFKRDGKKKTTKPVALRLFFVKDKNFHQPKFGVSHLCHNDECMNRAHIILEHTDVNQSRYNYIEPHWYDVFYACFTRNGCPGGPLCYHKYNCIRPGPWAFADKYGKEYLDGPIMKPLPG